MQVDSKTRKILNRHRREDNKADRARRHDRDERLLKQRQREQEQMYR